MKALPKTLLYAIVLALAAAAGYWTSQRGDGTVIMPRLASESAADEDAAAVAPATGRKIYALRLPDANGAFHDLSELEGKVVVINFWATWCPPCRREIPDFVDVYEANKGTKLAFIGLSLDMPDKVAQFRDTYQVSYPLLIAQPDILELAAQMGNVSRALPFTVILDGEGMIRHLALGTLSKSELEGKIRALMI